jgi:integrase
MPKPRRSALESATARLKLPVAKKPVWLRISPGIHLGYRRNAGPGAWVVRSTLAGSGRGREWTKRIGLADDLEKADGRAVLSYWQALDEARKLARRQPGDDAGDETRPLTVLDAVAAYARDLEARGADSYNAKRARLHVTGALASKPVALLTTADMVRWRDALVAGGLAPSSVNRVRTCLRAALTLAAKRDRRIVNRHVWEEDLAVLPNATVARNTVLTDAALARLVATAHAQDLGLGLLVHVIAETGARPSQAVRLTVADLDARDPAAPRLMMPRSGKGHAHKRSMKMQERVPVPVTSDLARRLQLAAVGRQSAAQLLLQTDGQPWGFRRSDQYRLAFAKVVEAAGLDPAEVTLYACRHTAISRSLLAGTPVTLVADLCDTSEREIRKHYAKLIAHHGHALARLALPVLGEPIGGNVVKLAAAR